MAEGVHAWWVACVAGEYVWQGEHLIAGDMCGRRDGHCSGRYASYCNALNNF